MVHVPWSTKWASVGLAALLLGACGPRAETGGRTGAEGNASRTQERPTLTLAIAREPSVFNWVLTTASEIANGLTLVKQIPKNQLMVLDDRGVWVPQLAAEDMSIERGTWLVNSDGTMDTTWKLRPNIRWQDGTPFTSDDLLFTFTVYKDPDLPNRDRAVFRSMESATAPDPLTFVVHWSQAYRLANQMDRSFDPLPKHLMERPYRADKEAFLNNSLFREDFIGLGAYRLVNWEPGSHMEFVSFDDYYLGRPPLAKVLVRIIPDLNTMVAGILSGSVDVINNVEFSVETAQEVRDRWQGTGNQVQFVTRDTPFWLEIQHRPEIARPVNGLTNRTVRQALLQGIDRQAILESLTAGLGQLADSWVSPTQVDRPQLAASIPQFPYDPTRAQQLLAQAGWARGASGPLLHQVSREVFQVEARADVDTDSEKLMAIVGNSWGLLGAQVSLTALTPALKNDNEFRARFSGVHGRAAPSLPSVSQLHSKFQASADTRWIGGRSGYSNPRADPLLDRYPITIEPTAQLALERELLQEVIGDLALMPMYWPVEPNLAVKGVAGVKSRDGWNFHEWTKQ